MATYDIAYIDSSFLNLKRLRFDTGPGTWSTVGSGLNIFTGLSPKICIFKPNTVAYYSNTTKKLDAYYNSGTAWGKISINSRPQFLPDSNFSMSCCYPSRVLFSHWKNTYNSDQFTIVNKYFNGKYFTTVNGELAGDGFLNPHVTAPTDINCYAYLADGDNKLKYVKIINGVHTVQGTPYSFTNSFPAMCGLYKNTVAIFDFATSQLRTMQFNTTTLTWSQLGSPLTIAGASLGVISGLDSDKIAYYDSGNQKLRVYQFSGGLWAQIGTEYSTSIGGNASLSSFTSFIPLKLYNEVPVEHEAIWPSS